MYLQITSKCNFTCDHCCFSHGFNRGKHGDYYVIERAIEWYSSIDDAYMTIGGGEPTNHPRFFDILRRSLQYFEQVHMVTNGSNTPAMKRLYNILTDQDYPDLFDEMSDDEQDIAMGNYHSITLEREHQFCVALSQDRYHSAIDPWVKETWEKNSVRELHYEWGTTTKRSSRFSINTFGYVQDVGRAHTLGIAESHPFVRNYNRNPCVCEDIFIKPNGDVRMCGCPGSPIVGNIFSDNQLSSEYYDAQELCDGDHPCIKRVRALRKKKAA